MYFQEMPSEAMAESDSTKHHHADNCISLECWISDSNQHLNWEAVAGV